MKQVAVLGLGLVGSLALAWSVYTDDGEGPPEGAIALYTDPGDALSSLQWDEEGATVLIESKRDRHGEYLWVSVTEEEPIPTAAPPAPEDADSDAVVDADTEADTEAARPTEPVTRSFKGNLQATELWATFSPLYALRDLSSGASSTAFGLDNPEATITVTIDGVATELQIGGETFGNRDRYVGRGEQVFLVDDGDLRPLQFAKTRLVERGLLPYGQPDVAQITLRGNGTEATWLHQDRELRGADYWAREATPDDGDEAVKDWMRKLLSVRAQAYVLEDELDHALEPVLTYTVTGDDGAWTVEVLRESTDGDNGRWYARSEYTRSLVELTRSLAVDAFMDMDVVL